MLGLSTVIQAAFGVASLVYLLPFGGIPGPVTFYEAVIRTGHQTFAAILVGSSVTLALRALGSLAARPAVAAGVDPLATASGPVSVPANLEVVA